MSAVEQDLVSIERTIPMRRVWAMPDADTFNVRPIGGLVRWYLSKSKVSVDPFARNKRWATYTNDLNPETQAESHLPALDFLRQLGASGVKVDLVVFDPPYSINQAKVCYESFGNKVFTAYDAQNVVRWTDEKAAIADILEDNGVFIQCGWNSAGMGLMHGCEIEQLLIVCHGPAHNDTIVTVERKVESAQASFI